MPCNSDYLNQTPKEKALQETAQLCMYVDLHWSMGSVPREIQQQAREYYAKDVGQVEWLCRTLTDLKENYPATFEKIVYDAHDAEARRLANWWEIHQAADAERKQQEADTERRAQLREQVLAKMDDEEREAFARYLN